MDPISVTGLVIAVVQVAAACLKSSRIFVGPSQHSHKYLHDIISDLYSFNAAIKNLETHLQICEEDQGRLNSLSDLKEPLETSKTSLELIENYLKDPKFMRKHVLGVRFDEKLKGCMRSLKMSRTLFEEVLQMSREFNKLIFMNIIIRIISSATERYVRNIGEDVTSIQNSLQSLDVRSQQNHQELRAWHVSVEQQKQDDETRKILSWLSSLDFVAKHNDVLSGRHEQTGAWFVNSSEFQDWLAGPARMLWCPGIPGAGKTVLASISIDHLQKIFKDENVAVVCVFCNHADQGNQKSLDLVASILEQLVQTKGVSDKLRILYQHHQTRANRPGHEELSELLRSTIQGFAKVFIVIDALDECPQTTRETFFGEIHKLRSVAHLLVTSRPSSSIACDFEDSIHLEINASDTDLEMYVQSKTEQDRRLARYVKEDPSLQEEVVATIVGSARGMFLLVHLHLESLAKQKNKREMRKALSSLPKELDETYDQAMERIRSQDTESVRLAERVLAWISNARRPFSVAELQHALAIQPGENKFDEEAIYAEDILVSVCAGLVTVDRNSKVIRLVHYTTQGYFERKRSELSPRSQLEIHIEIAKVCITYLELDDLRSDELTHEEEHIEVSDELRAKYPFLDYAGGHWGHHARGYTEYYVGNMIYRLLQNYSTLRLACDIIDDTGFWNFGPIPGMTLLIHFGLEHLISHVRLCSDSCLTCAIRYRDDTLVFLLTDRDANWYDDGEHFTNAGFSTYELEGKEDIVRLLADKGVMVDFSVDSGEFLLARSLLKYSGAERCEPMLTLLKLGATFDPQNITYYTPLMCAVIGGDKWDVYDLLDVGVDVNEKNQRGRDALNYAALARHEAVVIPLLDAGADIHSRDEEGMTALCAACQGGNRNIVKLLLKKGADISVQDTYGRTPVSIATEGGQETLIQLLLNHGIEGHVEDDVDSKAGVEINRAQFRIMWDFLSRDYEVGSSNHKIVESVRRDSIRLGLDKTVPAFLAACFEHTTSFEEHGTESSIPDEAFLDAYSKTKATEKDSTSAEEQETASSKPDDSTLRTDRA